MKETLIMKHAVGGRIFIDSIKHSLDYSIQEAGAGWLFTVLTPMNSQIEELIRLKHELNVFVFQEWEDRPTIKTWYYIKEGPVTYDSELQSLVVYAESRIVYVPDEFLTKPQS